MKKYFLIFILFFTSIQFFYAQSFENIGVRQAGDEIIITYDLKSLDPYGLYSVDVFSSIDNFTQPLSNLSGDVGKSVNQGNGKNIIWQATKSLLSYEGAISFELRGNKISTNTILPLSTNFPLKKTIKRGRKYMIAWSGGASDSKINIDLVQNGFAVESIARNINNSKQYEWAVPKNRINGKEFRILIKDMTYTGNEINSTNFKVMTPVSPIITSSFLIAAILGIYSIAQSK